MELIWFPVVGLAAVAGVRVIGVRIGWLRAFLVAWAGLATAGILLTTVAGESRSAPRVALVVALGLLTMIAWTGIIELFSSARSEPRKPGFTTPWRALRHKIARGRRKAEIAIVATRFGLSRYGRHHAPEPSGLTTGRALRGALERAGGVYVKLGQFLSTRPDLVSSEIAAELRRLQQSVDPVAECEIRAVIVDELPAGIHHAPVLQRRADRRRLDRPSAPRRAQRWPTCRCQGAAP